MTKTGFEQAGRMERLAVTAEPTTPTDWDEFVAGTPGGTFCHLAAWRGVMDSVLGHESFFVTARDAAGALQGVLPLVRVRSRVFGHYLVSMPFLNYGGPIGGRSARVALGAWARELARRDRADLLEFRWRQGALAGASERSSGPASGQEDEHPVSPSATESSDGDGPDDGADRIAIVERKVTVLLPLPETAEALWESGLKSKLRSQIRRPMKEGFDTRSGHGEVDAFYEVFARNMRDLGTPVLPKRLFEHLPAAFGDQVVFATVYDGATPIAAGCGFHFGGEFEITWASALREYNRTAPNMLLYWRLMELSIERGARTFNFGRCTPGGGTHRFKKQWGGLDEALPWGVWSPGGEVATPNPDQGKYRLATRVWSRLPVAMTRVIGPPLARRIP